MTQLHEKAIAELNKELDAEKALVAGIQETISKCKDDKVLQQHIIAGLKAKLALSNLNAGPDPEDPITKHEKTSRLQDAIILGLEARLALCGHKTQA